MEEWKHFCAKVAKSFKNQCETEGAGSHQSLWKPFRFWFGSLTFWDGGFGATVSHLMVPELEERSGRAAGAFLFSLFHLNSIHLIHTFIYF